MATKQIKDEFDDYDEDEVKGLIPIAAAKAKNVVLTPVRPLVSRPAIKAYLTTILVTITSITLFGLAVVAYVLFYWNYIPRIGFERPIHLQFDNVYAPHTSLAQHAHPYPRGTVSLTPDLVSQQSYDISVALTLPLTKENHDAGNFMLSVNLTNPTIPSKTSKALIPLATSRRTAILPYRSRAIDILHKLSSLPWYILGLHSETITLTIPIFERISFPRGTSNLPTTLQLEIQSTHRMQIYTATANFRARFTGLRWLMYNHRLISSIIFISTFFLTEMLFTGLAWGAISLLLAKGEEIVNKVDGMDNTDDEEVPLSDTERTFPTLTGQPPLRYTSPPRNIKQEVEDEAVLLPEVVTKGAEADVEDEEDVDFFDSGIGTSMESSGPGRRDSVRRRRGQKHSSTPIKREDE